MTMTLVEVETELRRLRASIERVRGSAQMSGIDTAIIGNLTVGGVVSATGGLSGPGMGDMLAAQYDTNGDYTVDAADYAAAAGEATHAADADHATLADSASAIPWAVLAGDGLSGGGVLSADRTLAVGAGAGISVTADAVAVDTTYAFTWAALHTFNAGATIAAAQALGFGADVSLARKAANILQLAAGDSLQSATYASGVSGWTISADGAAEFSNARIRGELSSTVFKYNEIQATAGAFGVFKSASTLSRDLTTPAGVGNTVHVFVKTTDAGAALVATNDRLRIKSWTGAAVADSWFTVSAVSTASGESDCTCTLSAGTTNAALKAGTAVTDWGPANSGALILSADGAVGSPVNLSIVTHAGSPWTALTLRARLGNLNGAYGVTGDYYGLGVGDYAGGNYLKYDTNGGFLFKSVNGTLSIDAVGAHFTLPVIAGLPSPQSIDWGSYSVIVGGYQDASGNNHLDLVSLPNLAGKYGQVCLYVQDSALAAHSATLVNDQFNLAAANLNFTATYGVILTGQAGTTPGPSGSFIRVTHENRVNLDDGIIAANRYREGLNIVGVQTILGNGRKIHFWGDLTMNGGSFYGGALYDNSSRVFSAQNPGYVPVNPPSTVYYGAFNVGNATYNLVPYGVPDGGARAVKIRLVGKWSTAADGYLVGARDINGNSFFAVRAQANGIYNEVVGTVPVISNAINIICSGANCASLYVIILGYYQ